MSVAEINDTVQVPEIDSDSIKIINTTEKENEVKIKNVTIKEFVKKDNNKINAQNIYESQKKYTEEKSKKTIQFEPKQEIQDIKIIRRTSIKSQKSHI